MRIRLRKISKSLSIPGMTTETQLIKKLMRTTLKCLIMMLWNRWRETS